VEGKLGPPIQKSSPPNDSVTVGPGLCRLRANNDASRTGVGTHAVVSERRGGAVSYSEAAVYNPSAMKNRILSISYNEALLKTRELLLKKSGFEVTSALGFAEALEQCQSSPEVDLILLGHSMPPKDMTALIRALRPKCNAPVLSIRVHGDQPLPESNYSVDSHDGPAALIEAVKSALSE
jgi:hypothetical protein